MARHKKPEGVYTNMVLSIRLPKELKDRIDALARKGLVTRNAWIVHALKQKAYRAKIDKIRDIKGPLLLED